MQTTDGQVTAYEPDAMLTRLYTAPSGVEAGATTATTVQRALAELAVITRETETDQPHLLIAPGRGWDPDVATVAALTTAFAEAPWVRLAPVATLLDADEPDTRGTSARERREHRRAAPASVRALADARAAPSRSPGSPASRPSCSTGWTTRSSHRCRSRGASPPTGGTPSCRR